MDRDVFSSLLAFDSYNRGYGQNVLLNPNDNKAGQNEAGRRPGTAVIRDTPLPAGSVAAGFYAIAYDWNGERVISCQPTRAAPCR